MSRAHKHRIILGVLAVVAAAQLVQPDPPGAQLPGEGTIHDHVTVPEKVDDLLQRACYDCHSSETRWPWYAEISPVSWLIVRDVRHGRGNLDFSAWSTDPSREPTPVQRLRWICSEVRHGEMPPRLYRWAHPEARLGEEDEGRLCEWTVAALEELEDDPSPRR